MHLKTVSLTDKEAVFMCVCLELSIAFILSSLHRNFYKLAISNIILISVRFFYYYYSNNGNFLYSKCIPPHTHTHLFSRPWNNCVSAETQILLTLELNGNNYYQKRCWMHQTSPSDMMLRYFFLGLSHVVSHLPPWCAINAHLRNAIYANTHISFLFSNMGFVCKE